MRKHLTISAKFESPFTFADFDRKPLKKGFRKIGREVAALARRMVSERGVSLPGTYPGRETGVLRLSIAPKVSRSGFSVGIAHYASNGKVKAAFAKKGFYPAYVFYGHAAPGGALRQPNGKRKHRANPARKVAQPRANYIVDAADAYSRSKWEGEISKVLTDALKPVEIKIKP